MTCRSFWSQAAVLIDCISASKCSDAAQCRRASCRISPSPIRTVLCRTLLQRHLLGCLTMNLRCVLGEAQESLQDEMGLIGSSPSARVLGVQVSRVLSRWHTVLLARLAQKWSWTY